MRLVRVFKNTFQELMSSLDCNGEPPERSTENVGEFLNLLLNIFQELMSSPNCNGAPPPALFGSGADVRIYAGCADGIDYDRPGPC